MILGYFQIPVRWAPSYAARSVEMRAMTRAKETTPYYAGIRDRHASQMRTDAYHDQPLRSLDSVFIRFRIAQLRQIHSSFLIDDGLCPINVSLVIGYLSNRYIRRAYA